MKIRAMPMIGGAKLLDLARVAAGLTLSTGAIIWGYVTFYNPLELDPSAMRADVITRSFIRIYMTGEKKHDRCHGDWQVLVKGENGFSTESRISATGPLPVGLFNQIPREVTLREPLPAGDNVGQMVITYHCLVDFRHSASFPLTVRPTPKQ